MKIKNIQGTAIIGRSVALTTTEQVAMTKVINFIKEMYDNKAKGKYITTKETDKIAHYVEDLLIPFCEQFCLAPVDEDKTFDDMFKQVANKRTDNVLNS